MKRWFPALLAVAVIACAIAVNGSSADDATQPPGLVVGTYDSRCIAVAFKRSSLHNMDEQLKAYDKAKADGDTKKVAELERWGETQQRKAHFQAFGQYPVHDILDRVKDKLPTVAEQAGVGVIVCRTDYTAQNMKTVDITDELVALFDPDEKTLKTIQSLRTKDPIPFETLIHLGHDH